MDLSTKFKVDPIKAEKGVPMDMEGTIFYLAYFNTTSTQVIFQAKIAKYKNTMSLVEASTKALREVLVEHIIKGWEKVEENGVEIEYSSEEATRILEEYVGLDAELMAMASNIQEYKREDNKKIKKKLPKRSGGQTSSQKIKKS